MEVYKGSGGTKPPNPVLLRTIPPSFETIPERMRLQIAENHTPEMATTLQEVERVAAVVFDALIVLIAEQCLFYLLRTGTVSDISRSMCDKLLPPAHLVTFWLETCHPASGTKRVFPECPDPIQAPGQNECQNECGTTVERMPFLVTAKHQRFAMCFLCQPGQNAAEAY